jgi:hypothetical protein
MQRKKMALAKMRSRSESESSDSDDGNLELVKMRTDECGPLRISGLDDEEEKKCDSSSSSEDSDLAAGVGEYIQLFSSNPSLMAEYEKSFEQAMDTITKEVKRNKGPPPELDLEPVKLSEASSGKKTVCINVDVLVSTCSC